MNVELTVATVLGIIGVSVAIFASHFFESYERKIAKIKTAILGLLVNAKNDLVETELRKRYSPLVKKEQGKIHVKKGQEIDYEDFIAFMQKSGFLKFANEHEELLNFEGCGQNKVHKLALVVGGLVGPTILLQQEVYLILIGYLWLTINSAFLLIYIFDIKDMVKRIDDLYKEYVIGKESFGGYD